MHVTYGGTSALDVATLFRPDLMLIDSQCRHGWLSSVASFRQIPPRQTQIVAITGHTDEGHKSLAIKAGFDKILFKPVALPEIRAVLASVVSLVAPVGQSPQQAHKRTSPEQSDACRLAKHGESGRIVNHESSTQAESEAAICEGIIRFQEEYLGWGAEQIRVHLIKTSW